MTVETPARSRGVCVAAALVTLSWIGMSLGVWREIPGRLLPFARLATGAVCLLVLLIVWLRRSQPDGSGGRIGFGAIVLGMLVVLWLTDQGRAEQGIPWVPFEVAKLGSIVVALLGPEGWLGFATIGLLIGTSLVHYFVLGPEPRPRMTAGEPWSLVEYGVVATGLLYYRLRGVGMAVELARVRARATALQEIAQTLHAVRDLANTPLQTMALLAELLRVPDTDPRVLADRIDRALERLRELDHILSHYDGMARWSSEERSFDARERLRH